MGNSCQRQERQPEYEHAQYYRKPEVKQEDNRAQIPPPPDLIEEENNAGKVQQMQSIQRQLSYLGNNNQAQQPQVQPLPQPLPKPLPKPEPQHNLKPIAVPAKNQCKLLENYGQPCDHYDCKPSYHYAPSRRSMTSMKQPPKNDFFRYHAPKR